MKSKIIYLLLSLTLFCSGAAWGAWTTQESGTTQDLNSMCPFSDTVWYTVGNNGTIIKTINGGLSWEAKNTGTADYNDVVFPKYTEGYVCGTAGKLLKSVDGGETYALISLAAFPEIAAGNFVRGSALGDRRVFAVNNGAAASGYLFSSVDEGGSWATTALTNLAVDGALYATGEVTWVWGKYFAGDAAYLNKYVILKDGVVVWSDSTRGVRDIFMVDPNNGYAVGDSGLILKTTTGGGAGSWVEKSGITSKPLKSCFFITANFGWVVGHQGAAGLTYDGGTTWQLYDPADVKMTNVNKMAARVTINGSTASGHFFLVGSGGKIVKLASPKITSIFPAAKSQGWVGNFYITGEGFMDGASVILSAVSGSGVGAPSGQATVFMTKALGITPDPNIIMTNVSMETNALLTATMLIGKTTTVGSRDVGVTNPDATATTETKAFTVNQSTGGLTIEKVFLDNNAYVVSLTGTPENTIFSTSPTVTCEIKSTVTMSKSDVKAILIIQLTNNYIFSEMPQSAFTQINDKTVKVNYKAADVVVPFPYRGKMGTVEIYAEHLTTGNLDIKQMLVWFSSDDPSNSQGQVPAGTTPGMHGQIKLTENTWDFEEKASQQAQLNLQAGLSVQSATVRVFDYRGNLKFTKKIGDASVGASCAKAKVVTAQGIVTKYTFDINKSEMAPYLTAGIYVITVTDDLTNRIIAKNLVVFAPKENH